MVELLATEARVRLVYGFGSAASGGAGPLSDVDVAVLLDAPLDWHAERELRGRLGALVPRIDLVILNGAPPALRFEIVTSGRCLLARDPREQAEFEILSLSASSTFSPFGAFSRNTCAPAWRSAVVLRVEALRVRSLASGSRDS